MIDERSQDDDALRPTIGSCCSIVVAVLAASVVLLPIFKTHSDPSIKAQAAQAGTASVCTNWDERAKTAIASLLERTSHEGEPRQVAEAMERLRRARRNCQIDWIALACQEYHAIVHGSGMSSSRPTSPGVCGLALEDRSAAREAGPRSWDFR
jgi:hypothetical protein